MADVDDWTPIGSQNTDDWTPVAPPVSGALARMDKAQRTTTPLRETIAGAKEGWGEEPLGGLAEAIEPYQEAVGLGRSGRNTNPLAAIIGDIPQAAATGFEAIGRGTEAALHGLSRGATQQLRQFGVGEETAKGLPEAIGQMGEYRMMTEPNIAPEAAEAVTSGRRGERAAPEKPAAAEGARAAAPADDWTPVQPPAKTPEPGTIGALQAEMGLTPMSDEDRLRQSFAESGRREQDQIDQFHSDTQGMQDAAANVAPQPEAAPAFDRQPYLRPALDYINKGKGSLKPVAVAKALGITEEQANQVLGLAVSSPDAQVIARADGSLRRKPTYQGPQDLVQFAARRGGIKLDSDLQAMDAQRKFVPGAGMLAHSKGEDSDYVREAANEVGYGPYSTVADFYKAIDENLRGNRQFPQGEAAPERPYDPIEHEGALDSRAAAVGLERNPNWTLDQYDAVITDREAGRAKPAQADSVADTIRPELDHSIDEMRSLYDPEYGLEAERAVGRTEVPERPEAGAGHPADVEAAEREVGRPGEVAGPLAEGPGGGEIGAEGRQLPEAELGEEEIPFQRKPDEGGLFKAEPGAVDAQGRALPQTILPGMEQSAKQAAAARESKGQGKLTTGVQQKGAGPLFANAKPDEPTLFERATAPTNNRAEIKAANDPLPGPRPDPRQKLIGQFGDVKAYMVDGSMVRDHWFQDFTEGGNDQAYKEWFPKNEIWIDDKNADEAAPILLHELHERRIMKDEGLSYDAAHDRANVIENRARRDPQVLQAALQDERDRLIGEAKPVELTPGLEGRPLHDPTPEEQKIVDGVNQLAARIVPGATVQATRNLRSTVKGQEGPAYGAAFRAGQRRLIAWSLESPDAQGTLRHEAVHYLRRSGLLKDDEWSALQKDAVDSGILRDSQFQRDNGRLTAEQQIEEAVAERYRLQAKRTDKWSPALRPIYQKVRALLQGTARIARQVLGRDVTADDVWHRMDSGQVGARAKPKPAAADDVAFQKAQKDLNLPSTAQDLHKWVRGQEDELYRMRGKNQAEQVRALQLLKSLPTELRDPATREKLYQHQEEKTPLSPAEQALFDKYVKPIINQGTRVYQDIKKKGYPITSDGYIHRIVKGKGSMYDEPEGAKGSRPIYGRTLSKNASGLLNRTVFAADGDKGTFRIVSGPERKPGDTFTDHSTGETFKVRQATTREIEANTSLEYHKDAVVNSLDNLLSLKRAKNNIEYLENLKRDPTFFEHAAGPNAENIPRDWRTTNLPQLAGWRMDPKIANMLDDFYGHGRGDALSETLGKINHALTTAMFINPAAVTGHIMNVGAHWFVGRGWDNFLPQTWGRSATNFMRAMKDVYNLSPRYQQMLEEGSALMYAPVVTRDFHRTMIAAMGGEITKNPKQWADIARAARTTPAAIIQALSDLSSRGLWFTNDIMALTHQYDLQQKGLSPRAAIAASDRDIPNYRIPSAAWDGPGGRQFSRLMQSPNVLIFSRYRYGMLKAFANHIGDLVKGSGKERAEAAGKILALTALGTVLYPLADAAVQKATGDKDAEMRRAGPMSLVSNLAHWGAGEKGFSDAVSGLFSPAIGTGAIAQTVLNKNLFTGKPVYDPEGSLPDILAQTGYFWGQQVPAVQQATQVAGGTRTAKDIAEEMFGVRPEAATRDAKSKFFNQRASREFKRSFDRSVGRVGSGISNVLP